ncbi:hypothetical protein ACOMHN_026706 [Nucella lapillus]
MERFSADHIRQQPEFQFLLYREKSQVIQTCVEDGEIKLRIGHQPSPAKRDKARTPPRPTSGHNSTKSGASSTVSDAAVHPTTIARAQSASAADRPSADKSKTRQRKLGVVGGQIGEPPFEDRYFQDHSSVSRRSVVSNRFDETERRKGYEEHRPTHDDSKDGSNVGINHEKNHSNLCKFKGDTEISDDAQNKASNHLRQSRDIAERSKETNNHNDTTATPPNNRNIANGEHSNFPTNQNTELSSTVGERRAGEDRKLIKACSTSIRLTPEETTAEQLTNKTSKSDPRKSGGITELSADTASKHVTERGDYCEIFTDPEKQATRNNNITERKSCGITEQGRPFHAIDEDEKETKLTDHSTNDQGTTLHADGHTDGETQYGRHVPGKAKGVDKSRAEASNSLDHSSGRAAHSPSKSNKTPRGMTVDPSQEMEVTSDHGKDDYATLTGFTIPAIVVDKASTLGDASNYSDDVDAVSIDAEDYLTSTQSGKSGNQDSSSAQSFKQKVHNWYQLADPHVNAEWKLNVPPNPELQEENVSSTPYPQSSQHVLKSRLENTHIYNSSAALELSGLRTTLTPSPYNVEFNANTSQGPRSPHTDISIYAVSKPRASPHKSRHSPRPSTTDCTFQGRRSSTVSKTLTPKGTGTHRAPQLSEGAQPRSAISSRRSSVNSVHWDQAVTDPLALSRQTSWEGNRSEPPTHPALRRRHSTALGIRHEKLLDMADPAIIAQLSSASDPSMGGGVGSSPDFRRHSMGAALQDPTGERRLSTASALSGVPSQRSSLLNQEELDAAELARQASQYDPRVEKSERYNHQKENGTFNQACQWLTPVRRGLRTLQVHYSQTNTTHNDSLIFAHLLRAAHVKNAAVEDAVYSTERRLYTRRHTDVPHATTFFDIPPESDHPTTPTTTYPGGQGQKASQTVDGRQPKKNAELELGYTPRAQSLRQLGPEDMQAMLHQCRHLRVSPHLQQHLYDDTTTTTGIVAVLSPLVEEQQQIDTGTQAQAKATCAAAPAAPAAPAAATLS